MKRQEPHTFTLSSTDYLHFVLHLPPLLMAELQSPAELLAVWRVRLLAAAMRIRDAPIEAYPDKFDCEELAQRTGLTTIGGTFGAAVGMLRRYALAESGREGLQARSSWIEVGESMGIEVTASQEPVMTARVDLVAILEERHDVLLMRIDDESIDRRYVDFGALSKRLDECIEELQDLPH